MNSLCSAHLRWTRGTQTRAMVPSERLRTPRCPSVPLPATWQHPVAPSPFLPLKQNYHLCSGRLFLPVCFWPWLLVLDSPWQDRVWYHQDAGVHHTTVLLAPSSRQVFESRGTGRSPRELSPGALSCAQPLPPLSFCELGWVAA